MAAEGYAKFTCDRPALVQVTAGPGGTNALTGVMGAYVDSIPMIVVSGQCRYATSVLSTGLPLRTRGVQEFDIVNTVKTMTKYSKLVTDPLSVRREIIKAYDIAMNGRRGPVWIDIPLDIQGLQVEEADLLPSEPSVPVVSCSVAEIRSVLQMLQTAKRPCIIAGSSVRYSGNYDRFLSFLKKVRIPVASAGVHLDVMYWEHPLYVGAEGAAGQRSGNFVVQNADVILVLGASLSFTETGWVQENFAPRAKIISVNVDEYEHRKPGLHVDLFLHSDLQTFFDGIGSVDISPPDDWMDYVRNIRQEFDVFEGVSQDEGRRVNPYNFWRYYRQKADENAITCLGNSSCIGGWLRYVATTKEQRSFVNINCGSMGDDITEAEGVAAAAGRPVMLVTGDGSFMMNLQELATVRHNNLPIRMAIFSNGGYNALRKTWKRYFAGVNAGCDNASGISFPDFEKIAAAFGISYSRCSKNADIPRAIDWLMSQEGPAFLEVLEEIEVSPTVPCVISRLRQDGSSEPAWLQDMSPFIDRERYSRLMISER